MVTERPILAPAMTAYALSFGLVAVSTDYGTFPGILGHQCAWITLWNTFVVADRFQGKTIVFIALLTSGLINVAFLTPRCVWRIAEHEDTTVNSGFSRPARARSKGHHRSSCHRTIPGGVPTSGI